jgi:hypothetical protein
MDCLRIYYGRFEDTRAGLTMGGGVRSDEINVSFHRPVMYIQTEPLIIPQ